MPRHAFTGADLVAKPRRSILQRILRTRITFGGCLPAILIFGPSFGIVAFLVSIQFPLSEKTRTSNIPAPAPVVPSPIAISPQLAPEPKLELNAGRRSESPSQPVYIQPQPQQVWEEPAAVVEAPQKKTWADRLNQMPQRPSAPFESSPEIPGPRKSISREPRPPYIRYDDPPPKPMHTWVDAHTRKDGVKVKGYWRKLD